MHWRNDLVASKTNFLANGGNIRVENDAVVPSYPGDLGRVSKARSAASLSKETDEPSKAWKSSEDPDPALEKALNDT
jgi:hypothetical protein